MNNIASFPPSDNSAQTAQLSEQKIQRETILEYLIDNQSCPRVEKTYRLLESYVLKLPNISILNPGLTGEEIEFVLSILDLCKRIIELCGTSRLNTISEKIKAITPENEQLLNKETEKRIGFGV